MPDVNDFIKQGFRNISERIRTLESLQYPHPEIYETNPSVGNTFGSTLSTTYSDVPNSELVLPPGVYRVDGLFKWSVILTDTGLFQGGLKVNGKVQPDIVVANIKTFNDIIVTPMTWIVSGWDYRQLVLSEPGLAGYERFREYNTLTGQPTITGGSFVGNAAPLNQHAIGAIDLSGQPNYSIYFDGVNDYIAGAPGGLPVYYADNCALEIWFKTSAAVVQYLVGTVTPSAPTGASGKGAGMYINASGQVVAGLATGLGGSAACNSPLAYNDGNWHQALMTWGGGFLYLYIDGALVASTISVTPGHGGAPTVAAIAATPSATFPYNGYLSEFSCYTTLQTAQKVLDRYNAGIQIVYYPNTLYKTEVLADVPNLWWRFSDDTTATAADDSGNSRSGTPAGNVVVNQPGAIIVESDGTYNDAFRFDASTAYVSRADEAALRLTTGSLEAWVKTSAITQQYVVGNGDLSVQRNGLILSIRSDGIVQFDYAGAATVVTLTASPAVNDGAWHHIVATFDPVNGAAVYIDGALAAYQNGALPFVNFNGYAFTAGKNANTAALYFNGLIDEVALYPSVLSAARVRTHYLVGKSNRVWLTLAAYKNGTGTSSTLQQAKMLVTKLQSVSRS